MKNQLFILSLPTPALCGYYPDHGNETLTQLQEEQVGGANCRYLFNFSLTVDSPESGNDYVKANYINLPHPYGDNCCIGSLPFTITGSNSSNGFVITGDYRSDCFKAGTDETGDGMVNSLAFVANHAGDAVIITCPLGKAGCFLSVYSHTGKIVAERQVIEKEVKRDISSLPQGVYFVRVQDEMEVKACKMIVE